MIFACSVNAANVLVCLVLRKSELLALSVKIAFSVYFVDCNLYQTTYHCVWKSKDFLLTF